MAFDPSKYKAPVARHLPVILLLDVSGSMVGEKIETLYNSVVEMVDSFVASQVKETLIDVAIITFGAEVELHTPYSPVAELQKKGLTMFRAEGMTPMGVALKMAKDMIDDKDSTPSNIYRPAVILVSDGRPNDSWEEPMSRFISDGRSSKCQRFAVSIGDDADKDILERFTGVKENVMFAKDALGIADCFQKLSMTVSTRATSQNPNAISASNTSPTEAGSNQDVDEDEYI